MRKNQYKVVTVEELFTYIFGIYIKFGYKNPPILTLSNYIVPNIDKNWDLP